MRKMLGILLPAILLALAVAQAQDKTVAKPDAAAEKALIANERALQDAVAKADKASFRSLVVPGGVWTTKQGFIPLEMLVGGLDGFELTKWDIVNPHVTWIDDDSAIVICTWTGAGHSTGNRSRRRRSHRRCGRGARANGWRSITSRPTW